MAARNYSLDTKAAIEGSSSGYQRITDSGAYVGVFIKAKYLKAGTGAEGIQFTFRANNGAEAAYLDLYTHNSAGSAIYGYNQLNALMTCLKLRELKFSSATINEYDHSVGSEVQVNADIYPELMNKAIGVVLQREEYKKRDGSVGVSMNLYNFFDAETRQTGKEVLEKAPAKSLDSAIASLQDKRVAPTLATTPAATATQAPAAAMGGGGFDDDIPFAKSDLEFC